MFLFNNCCPCNNRNDRCVKCRCCEKEERRDHCDCRCKCKDEKPSYDKCNEKKPYCGKEQHKCEWSQQFFCCKCRKVQNGMCGKCRGNDAYDYDAYDDDKEY